MRGHRIMAITSAFQADDAGSIPAARSKLSPQANFFISPLKYPLNLTSLLSCCGCNRSRYLLPLTAGIKKPLQSAGARLRYYVPHIFGVNPTEVS